MMSIVLVLLLQLLELSSAYLLECPSGQTFGNRKYLPNLITVSRLERGEYKLSLRCRGTTLEGLRIQNDLRIVEKKVNAGSEAKDTFGDADAKYLSMSCGPRCFKKVVTERDLLMGRVCEDPRKEVLALQF